MSSRWPVYSKAALETLAQIVSDGIHVEFRKNPFIDRLENKMAEHFGRRFAVATNSGTSALSAAYYSLALEPGSRIAAPAYTFYATISAMLPLGLRPIFADFSENTLNVSAETMANLHTQGVSAAVVTHNWGNAISTDDLEAIKNEFGTPLIDDCSHMCGTSADTAFLKEKKISDISIVSLGARKIVTGGAGGVILTDDETLYQRIIAYCQPKRSSLYLNDTYRHSLGHITLGMNFRMSPLSAVLALDHLDNFLLVHQAWKEVGQEVAERINICNDYTLPKHAEGITVWYKVPVVNKTGPVNLEKLKSQLKDLRVSIDAAHPPFFMLEKFPHRYNLRNLPNYFRLIDRIATIDLSEEVGHRYRKLAGN